MLLVKAYFYFGNCFKKLYKSSNSSKKKMVTLQPGSNVMTLYFLSTCYDSAIYCNKKQNHGIRIFFGGPVTSTLICWEKRSSKNLEDPAMKVLRVYEKDSAHEAA